MLLEIMGTAEIRKEVLRYIEKADEKFLKMVHALARSYEDEEEDYVLPGPPMDIETYRTRIKNASDRAKAGNFTTQEDLEREMEKWFN